MSTRRITLLHATALVVANMVGTGIFTTTGLLVAQIGHPWAVLVLWFMGGLLALCGADIYGELGAMMPRAGGEYVYLREAFRPVVGFLSGWISLIVGFSAPIAAAAIAFGSYVGAVFPGVPGSMAATALLVGVTALHMVSVTWGSRVQTGFTILKVALLLGLIVGGFTIGEGSFEGLLAAEGSFEIAPLAVGLVFVSFAYSGYNGAAYVAGEIVDPGRNLPRALLLGTSLVAVLYFLLNVVFFYAVPSAQLAGEVEVGHVAARALFGETAGNVLSILIAVALVSSVSAMVMAGPRVYAAMADDGLFFSVFARRGRSGAPWASVLLQGAIALLLALTSTFGALLTYIGFTLSIIAGLTVVAAIVLRRRRPDAERPYRARGWPLSPALFLGLSAWMVFYTVSERPVESLAGVATLLVGLLVYVPWRSRTASR